MKGIKGKIAGRVGVFLSCGYSLSSFFFLLFRSLLFFVLFFPFLLPSSSSVLVVVSSYARTHIAFCLVSSSSTPLFTSFFPSANQ